METFEQELAKIRIKLVDAALLGSALYIIPTLASSIIRFVNIGWHYIFYFHIAVSVALLSLYFFRKRLLLPFKAHAFLGLFYLVSIIGTIAFQQVGGFYFVFTCVVTASLVFGIRMGVAYLILFMVSYLLISVLHISKVVQNEIDFNAYLASPTIWIVHFVGYLFGTVIILYITGMFYRLFTKSMQRVVQNKNEMQNAVKQLQNSEERFKVFMDNYPFAMSLKDSEGNFLFANRMVSRILKKHNQEIINTKAEEHFSDDIATEIRNADEFVLDYDSFIQKDVETKSSTGEKSFFKLIKFPLNDYNGDKLVGGISIDITQQKLTEARLARNEKKYRSIFHGSVDGFIFFNREFNFLSCNNSFCLLLGLNEDDVMQLNLLDVITNSATNNANSEQFKRTLTDFGYVMDMETDLVNINKELVPVEINAHQVIIEEEPVYWGVLRDLREKRKLEEEKFKGMVEAEENERARYAKELHDGLGPLLSTCKIYLRTIDSVQDPDKREEYMKRTNELVEEALLSIKEISNNLSPDILRKYGLIQALQSFIDKLGNITNIEFDVDTNLNCRLPEIVEFTLYRTMVELVNNSIKYAEASKIRVVTKHINNELKIQYTDNGKGFNYEEIKKKSKGFGLTNLENRINKIGGSYYYCSSEGTGVNVEVTIQVKCL